MEVNSCDCIRAIVKSIFVPPPPTIGQKQLNKLFCNLLKVMKVVLKGCAAYACIGVGDRERGGCPPILGIN